MVLWGKFGTGKTMTMNQLVHYAYTQDFILVSTTKSKIFFFIFSNSFYVYLSNVVESKSYVSLFYPIFKGLFLYKLLLFSDVEPSTYKKGRINTPHYAVDFINHFKTQNEKHWNLLSVHFIINIFIKTSIFYFRVLLRKRPTPGLKK